MSDLQDIARRWWGKFIVLDGPDGAGKETQLRRLTDLIINGGQDVLNVYDPGDTPAGERIRELLLLHRDVELDITCETLLFMASRAQLVVEKIRPALAAGKTVICDRFISATCAYQGAAGMDRATVIELGHLAVGDTWPDLTIILDVPAEKGLERVGLLRRQKDGTWRRTRTSRRGGSNNPGLFRDEAGGDAPDRLESRSLDYHRRVRENFRTLGAVYPGPVEVVDAAGSPDEVHAAIVEVLARVDL